MSTERSCLGRQLFDRCWYSAFHGLYEAAFVPPPLAVSHSLKRLLHFCLFQLPHDPTVPLLPPFPAQGGPLLSSVQPANTLTRAVNEAMARSFLPNGRQPAQSANERRLEKRNPFFHLPNVNQYFPKHSPRIMRNIPCPTSRGCVLSTTDVSLPQSIRIVRLCGGRRCLSDSFRRS